MLHPEHSILVKLCLTYAMTLLLALQGAKALQYLPKSQLLERPSMVQAFLDTAARLMSFALNTEFSSKARFPAGEQFKQM